MSQEDGVLPGTQRVLFEGGACDGKEQWVPLPLRRVMVCGITVGGDMVTAPEPVGPGSWSEYQSKGVVERGIRYAVVPADRSALDASA